MYKNPLTPLYGLWVVLIVFLFSDKFNADAKDHGDDKKYAA